MDKIAMVKKEVQLQNWSEMELTRQQSGMKVAQWCEQEHINHSTYYYRLRKVREGICEQIPVQVAKITENTESELSAIRITNGNISIEMVADVPTNTVTAVIRELKC